MKRENLSTKLSKKYNLNTYEGLKAAVLEFQGIDGYDMDNKGSLFDAYDLGKALAEALEAEERRKKGFFVKVVAFMVKHFPKTQRYFERRHQQVLNWAVPPPDGWTSWAEYRAFENHYRLLHPAPPVWVDGQPRSWGMPYDSLEAIPPDGKASNVAVGIDGKHTLYGDDTVIKMVSPQEFGITQKDQVKAIADGKVDEWLDSKDRNKRSGAQMDSDTVKTVLGILVDLKAARTESPDSNSTGTEAEEDEKRS